ncbi:uncharacterized protein LOC141640800 [Silene latifolia]|uniref:uncharacterized protein LOC141640800 n=1 Tax=Silene latifolia TaxID=37657 RepID=UPI003D77AAD7
MSLLLSNSYSKFLATLVIGTLPSRLRRPFTAKEVRKAVFQIGALKSPGPDGVPGIFYQKCWHFVKHDVTKAVLSILNSGMVLKELNRTFITLVPKTEHPEGVGDYRPISLCNVFMRIVSKCISNRLSEVMGYLVGDFQNAFIPGRQISDNILLANEAIHKINSHKKGKSGRFALKVDMSKAYDRVQWDFLKAVLLKFGFPNNLVVLIMNCVTTVSYQVLINGTPLDLFHPRCGLRQGDPLSPFLFVLCMEVLSANMIRSQMRRDLRGVSLCHGEENLSHLFFADDAVFFLQYQNNAAHRLRIILDKYCSVSGQVINDDKSGVLFSPSTRLANARRCLHDLRIKGNKGLGKYLGLSTDLQGSKKELFKGLIDQVMQRISSWNGIFLSPAGRLTLISSVLSNLSNYVLSVFKIPVSVTKKLNALLSHFWWAGCKERKTINWCSQRFLSLPKSQGGLGLRNIQSLNQALLAKHAWRILSGHNSLLCRVFRKILIRHRSPPYVVRRRNDNNLSWGARSILHGIDFLKQHIGWKPGINSRLNVWTSKWVNGECPEPREDLLSLESVALCHMEIKDLQCLESTGESFSWNEVLVRQMFVEESANRILAMPICGSQSKDKVVWLHSCDGEYSVKSGYGIIRSSYMERNGSNKDKTRVDAEKRSFCKKRLWQLPVPATWRILVWRIITNTLSVGANFAKRGINIEHSCKLYNHLETAMDETMEHLFRDCEIAKRIWACSELGIRVDCHSTVGIAKWVINWINYLAKMDDAERRMVRFIATLWCLWSCRNRVLFGGEVFHPRSFFNIWSNVTLIADQARDEVMKRKRKGDTNDHNDEDVGLLEGTLAWLRGSNPVLFVGGVTDCERVRIMVDAGWKSVDRAGFGWVALGSNGDRLFEGRKAIKAESAIQAEAIGIKEVLLWAKQRGFWHLEVSTDCLSIVCFFAGIERTHYQALGVLEDIRVLGSFFHCLSFSFIPRSFNMYAHGLACKAMSS